MTWIRNPKSKQNQNEEHFQPLPYSFFVKDTVVSFFLRLVQNLKITLLFHVPLKPSTLSPNSYTTLVVISWQSMRAKNTF